MPEELTADEKRQHLAEAQHKEYTKNNRFVDLLLYGCVGWKNVDDETVNNAYKVYESEVK